MPLVDICGQPVSDCETIDRTQETALLNARKAFPNAKRHRDTRAAIDNLINCLNTTAPPTRRVMIVGHGKPGLIVTGTGTVASDQDKRIEMGNLVIWQAIVARLKDKITELTLCSCETGAGPQGAQLLSALAKEVGARVSGFTKMIFIDGNGSITCEPGGQWQHADAGVAPPSIPHAEIHMESIVNLRLKENGNFTTLDISKVSAVKYLDSAEEGKARFSLKGVEAQKLVSTINFAEPSEIKGAPLALITGVIEIEFTEKRAPRSFTLYNDRLLQDQAHPDAFYFATPQFAAALSKYR
jgi:uncharacterized protein DUF4347